MEPRRCSQRVKEFGTIITLLVLIHVPHARSDARQPSGEHVELHWSELGSFIAQGRVTTVLPDGTVLKGQSVAVNDDALVLNVETTSDKKAHPKGRTSIPRDQITTLSFRKKKGFVGRLSLTLGGILGPLLVSSAALSSADEPNGTIAAAVLGGMVAGGVGGYYLGRSIDSKTTVIKILPD